MLKSTAPKPASAQKSSILKSSFAPSTFQLRLFASVIQSFESQQLRIHDASTGRLRCQHAAKPAQRITCLDWGFSKPHITPRHKSRKRDDVLLAYGTSTSEVYLFSPTEGSVVGELSGQHEQGITDFKFSTSDSNEGWSLGGDGKLVKWDISRRKAVRTITLQDSSTTTISPVSASSILCASSTPHLLLFDDQNDFAIQSFDAMGHPINSIHPSDTGAASSPKFFLAADGDRYMNVYDCTRHRLVRTLIASGRISSLTLDIVDDIAVGDDQQQVLAAVNKDGLVELFPQPFAQAPQQNGSIQSTRKNLVKKSTAQFKLLDSSNRPSAILSASFHGPEIWLVSVDSGVDLSFQKVRWQDEGSGDVLFTGLKEVIKTKSSSSLHSATLNGIKDNGNAHVDESNTVVTNGIGVAGSQDAPLELDDSGEDEDDDMSAPDKEGPADPEDAEPSDDEMVDAPENPQKTLSPTAAVSIAEEREEDQEPTFGDLAAALQRPKTIAIPTAPNVASLINSGGALSLPTGMSLSTVLTQALRTNDIPLLEACLHTTETDVVRNTITRLDPSLAANLISKLADRIVSRPGRYGHLQLWIQHLCVAHGAAISANPAARDKLKVLYRALDQRARGLPNLLVLKGKLQMVEGQLRFRREIAAQRAEQGVGGTLGRSVPIVVEGETENWNSDDDDLDEAIGGIAPARKRARKALDGLIGDAYAESSSSEDDIDDDDMPATLTNGIAPSDSDHEEGFSDDEDGPAQKPGKLVDDIADLESGSESASDDDDESEADEEDDDDDEDNSEMDDFINDDDDPSVADDDSLLDDAPPETADDAPSLKPKTKRRKT
jgi:U3 small nucleolar RNA-associated protein 5